MKNLLMAIRALFKKGRHNIMKIFSLGIGLAMGLVLIAKVYFEYSYNDFYPDSERIYRVQSKYTRGDTQKDWECTAGGIAPTLKIEIPEIEQATRFTGWGEWVFTLTDAKTKFAGETIIADSCLFDVLSRPMVIGNAKEILSRPMYVLVSERIAMLIGGNVVGKTFSIDEVPGRVLTIGGVFKDMPENSTEKFEVIISMASASQFMWEKSPTNMLGNDRYDSFVKLYPGTDPGSLENGIRDMVEKYFPVKELKKDGLEISFGLYPVKSLNSSLPSVKRMMWLLSLLAFALIFTAVMNYILIVVSTIVNRSKEMALYKYYGASGEDIYKMVFTEAFVHILISLLLALGLILLFRGTVEELLGISLPALFVSKGSLLLLSVCIGILLITGFASGYLYNHIPLAYSIRNYRENKRMWKLGLLFIQIVAATFLIALLPVIQRQYDYMVSDNPGYAYKDLAYCNVAGMDSTYRQQLSDELLRLPGVKGVSFFTQLPFVPVNQLSGNNVTLPGEGKELFNIADLYEVSDKYLELMEIPVIAGHSFTEHGGISNEVMVDRNFVEKMKVVAGWTDNIVGKSICVSEHSQRNDAANSFTICGVYENIRLGSISDQDPRPSVLFYSSNPADNLLIKFQDITAEAFDLVQEKVNELYPDRQMEIKTFRAELTNRYRVSRQFRDSVMIGGLITLLITVIGLIGYTTDEMNRRRKEIAIRRVSGSTVQEIIRIFIRDIFRIALPAALLGGGAAYYVARRWQEEFTEKIPLSFYYFAGGILFVCIVIQLCVLYRTFEVANDNPVNSLKSE